LHLGRYLEHSLSRVIYRVVHPTKKMEPHSEVEAHKLDLQANEKTMQSWNDSADWYEGFAEQYTTQGLVTCAVMCSLFQADRKQRVLEVACGPGRHSLLIAQSFLRPDGAVLVSCDYASAMVEKMAANYESADYSMVDGNSFVMETNVDYCEMNGDTKLKHTCDLEKVVSAHVGEGQTFRKFVYGCRANNELLPFADETFSAYLANLSVMLVDKPSNQFKEAHRVLQKGCSASFVIWGTREETLLVNHVERVLQKHLPPQLRDEMMAERSHHDLFYGKHLDVEKTLREIGFSQVKMWLQPMNFLFRNGEDFMKGFGSGKLKGLCTRAGFDEQKMSELHTECVEEFDRVSGANTTDLRTFQVQVIVCFKD